MPEHIYERIDICPMCNRVAKLTELMVTTKEVKVQAVDCSLCEAAWSRVIENTDFE